MSQTASFDVANKYAVYLPGTPDHHNGQANSLQIVEDGTSHDDVESRTSLEFIEDGASHADVNSCLHKEITDALRDVAQANAGDSWSEPKVESSRTSIRSIGTHSSYARGVDRPRLRGWLHCVVSVLVLPPAFLTLSMVIVLQRVPARWILLDLFLAGKFMVYSASATFHMFPFSRQNSERLALMADLVMLSVMCGVSPVPFTLHLEEGLASFGVHASFLALTVAVVSNGQYEGHRLVGRRACVRIVLLISQWVVAELQILMHLGYTSPFWWTSLILCILGFSCFGLRNSKYSMPWHSPFLCGWHEDFHSIMFFADVLVLVAAVQFLLDPTRDQAPNWMF